MHQPEPEDPIPLQPGTSNPQRRSSQEVTYPPTSNVPSYGPEASQTTNQGKRKRFIRDRRLSSRNEGFREADEVEGRSPYSFRHMLYLLLERPTSSSSAFMVHWVTNSIIVLSAILTILETIPLFHAVDTALWFGLETAIVAIFTMEYIARSLAWGFGERNGWKTWRGWAISFFALIDLFAILPYYIELVLRADTTDIFRFSILRTFRLLRVFRPFRYSSTILLTIEVMILSTRRSKHALLALSFFITMALVVFSTLLYFAERGTWDEALETFVDSEGVKTQFESIPAAAWFVLVTITTVGYGEIIPRTFIGRLVTVPLLLLGMLLVALPSFVLGREFAVVWEEMSAGVLDGLSLYHAPDSPVTPYTGHSAAAYDLLPEEVAEVDMDADQKTLVDRNSSARKGKGRVVFDSNDHKRAKEGDEEIGLEGRPIGGGIVIDGTGSGRGRGHSIGSGRGSGGGAISNTTAPSDRAERKRRVDVEAESKSNKLMNIHRRVGSKVDLLGMGGTSMGSIPHAAQQRNEVEVALERVLKELKAERDALRAERETLRIEREVLASERVELRREREELKGRTGS